MATTAARSPGWRARPSAPERATPRPRPGRRALAVALLASLSLAAAATAHAEPGADPDAGYSLLVLGDTGKRRPLGLTSFGQLTVGQSLAWWHARHPADAVVLLGDNFYPSGLEAHELAARVRANLVRPYCALLALDGACSPEVAGACGTPAAERRPVPWLAVLGNHDHESPESPGLQRERLPCFLPGWDLPEAPVARRRLAPGVDLIRYDARELADGARHAALTRAIAAAPGPWRVLAGHAPLADDAEAARIRAAVAAAGVPVQLHLAGHDHRLALYAEPGPVPAQLVSGAGSEARAARYHTGEALFAAARLGFAELRWPAAGSGERLEIRLLAASRWPLAAWSRPELLARFAVDRAGRLRQLATAPEEGG